MTEQTTDNGERFIDERDAAKMLSLTEKALQKWRLLGTGPKYVKLSPRCVRYKISDIIQWAESKYEGRKNDSKND